MKALAVRQPWASLIASGKKTIELRSWSTDYRGPLLIVASSNIWPGTKFPIGPRSCTLCLVDLVDVRPRTKLDTLRAKVRGLKVPAKYRWAWVLRNPRLIEQLPAKGKLKLYAPDAEMLAKLGLSDS